LLCRARVEVDEFREHLTRGDPHAKYVPLPYCIHTADDTYRLVGTLNGQTLDVNSLLFS